MSTPARTAINQESSEFLVPQVSALNPRGEEMRGLIVDNAFDSMNLGHNNADIIDFIESLLEEDTYFTGLGHNVNTNNNGGVSRVVQPANQDFIQNLERVTIQEIRMEQSSDFMCSICREEFSVGSVTIRLPHPCSHFFHEHCIIRWFNRNNTCPLCRRTIYL